MFPKTEIHYILMPVMLVMVLVFLARYLRERKQDKTVTEVINRLKFMCIFYGIIIFILLLCLPVVWYRNLLTPEKIKSVQKSIELQSNIAFDLQRMRDVIYWAFLITIFWFCGMYKIVKEIVSKTEKRSD